MFRVWGSQVLSGDMGSSTLPGVFWGAVPQLAAAFAGKAGCSHCCLISLEICGFGAAWERWGTAEEKGSVAVVTL